MSVPLEPITPAEPLKPTVLPTAAPTRSPVLLLGVGILAVLLLITNTIGLVAFPDNAPVEQIYALGINLDLLAIAAVCGVGAFLSRRGYPLRGATPLSKFAVAMAGTTLVAWVVFGGVGSVVELIAPGRGRYMYAAGGLFYAGAPLALATIFGAHAYRRGGDRTNNLLSIIAIVVVGMLVLYAVGSSLAYGGGFTD